jgi:cyclophilin family peptidyl-prolyl cis-trans isomerase
VFAAPDSDKGKAFSAARGGLAMSVTLHTNHGDLKLEIYCDTVPRTAFNFLALAASGYYDGTIFHRNVKGFMLQGGDPTGTGKGGESIWGKKFGDEIRPENTHSTRGILSMAVSACVERPNSCLPSFCCTSDVEVVLVCVCVCVCVCVLRARRIAAQAQTAASSS